MQKLYITKYALTGGIETTEWGGKQINGHIVLDSTRWRWVSVQLGRTAFLSESEAIQAAMALRDRKVASLQKQIEKVRRLQFTVKESSQ